MSALDIQQSLEQFMHALRSPQNLRDRFGRRRKAREKKLREGVLHLWNHLQEQALQTQRQTDRLAADLQETTKALQAEQQERERVANSLRAALEKQDQLAKAIGETKAMAQDLRDRQARLAEQLDGFSAKQRDANEIIFGSLSAQAKRESDAERRSDALQDELRAVRQDLLIDRDRDEQWMAQLERHLQAQASASTADRQQWSEKAAALEAGLRETRQAGETKLDQRIEEVMTNLRNESSTRSEDVKRLSAFTEKLSSKLETSEAEQESQLREALQTRSLIEAMEQDLARALPGNFPRSPERSKRDDSFYLEFENRYRGSEEQILQKCRPYLDWLSEVEIDKSEMKLVDCGCGRGEWLALLKENGYEKACGIDTSEAMVKMCQSKGYNVKLAEAIEHLSSGSQESIHVITAFHVIEHLPFSALLDFFAAALRALVPGGLLLLETPNPRNVVVGSCTFHFDPTHIKPLPSELVSTGAEFVGFKIVKLLQQNPHPDLITVAEALPQGSGLLQESLRAGLDYGLVLQK